MVKVHREQIEPSDRASWRRWLSEHGDTSPGVWVVLRRKRSGPQSLSVAQAVEEALCFGWIDSTLRHLDEQRNELLFAPRRPGGTWSRANKQRVARLAEQGLMTTAGEHAIERAKADGSWSALNDIDDLVVRPDLAATLDANPQARAAFGSLTDSKKKEALWWIASARRPATRERRIAETVRRNQSPGAAEPSG